MRETASFELNAGALEPAARLATSVFAGHPFYQRVLGFDEAAFAIYWRMFLGWVVREDSVRIYATEEDGRLLGLLVVADHRFPPLASGSLFAYRLARRIGLRRAWAYLRFAAAYQRFLHRPHAEARCEARGLWLMVAPHRRAVGLGRVLARLAMEAVRRRGYTVISGLIDAGDPRLVHFYQRIGFTVMPPSPFRRQLAARIELRIPGTGRTSSCGS